MATKKKAKKRATRGIRMATKKKAKKRATKKPVVTLTPEQRAKVKAARKAKQFVYLDGDGNIGAAKRQKGANKGHRTCK